MSDELRTSILLHLCECEECEARYVLAAKAFGVKFNLKSELKKYHIDFVEDPTEGAEYKVENYPVEVEVEIPRSEYGKYAKAKKIDKLMEVYAVKEYFKANQKEAKDNKAMDEFNWYIIEQICRKVDLLENLYNLSNQTRETKKDA